MPISRVLIVGLGSIGKRHLRLARSILPNSDIRILRHQATSEEPEYANGCYFDLAEAITFAPQIAIIASPAPFHIETAMALVSAGVDLLIEKPLSNSSAGVMQLLKACQKRGVILLTGYNLRFLPSLSRFRELLGEGAIGRVLSVRCEVGQYLPSWRPESDYRRGVSARRDMGGGALLELSHELDYLRWIFGEVDWVRATLTQQSALEIDVEDSAQLTMGFASMVDGPQLIGTVNLDFVRHDSTRLCTAIGETGSLRWNGATGVVELYEAGKKGWRELFNHPQQRDDSYLAEWEYFITCVNKRTVPLVSGEDGLKVLKIIEAARKSAPTGCQMFVEPFAQASEDNS